MNIEIMKAVLGLEDGTYVTGEGFGVEGECRGELVFSTQMTGYMEALTDASYFGQMLLFTYPLIGNYGVDLQNFQAKKPWALACIAREICAAPSTGIPMLRYFEDNGLLGMSGIDTRMLTIKTRVMGTLRAALVVGDDNCEYAVERATTAPQISEEELIPTVSCKGPYHVEGRGKRIAVIDLGIKKNMVISLRKRDADLYVYPYNASATDILGSKPDALFISNGPGDPMHATHAIQCVKELAGNLPIFGICMGNQVCGLALGAKTYKMKFGHRGTNQPVRNSEGKIFITTQNHGYAVAADTLPEGCRVSFENVNDGTLEGFTNNDLKVTTVQFHPEAHGGPRDTEAFFFDSMFRRIS